MGATAVQMSLQQTKRTKKEETLQSLNKMLQTYVAVDKHLVKGGLECQVLLKAIRHFTEKSNNPNKDQHHWSQSREMTQSNKEQ